MTTDTPAAELRLAALEAEIEARRALDEVDAERWDDIERRLSLLEERVAGLADDTDVRE